MSTTIDERVVEMRFDNKQFESGVQTTMSTLDKLKQKLNFSGAEKGFENVNNAAKKVDVSGIGAAVETVKARFSALEVMGVTALANITNAAVNAGKRMIAAFTTEPIQTGFNEFELKMGSVQTIMASTGESLDTVNKYLEELNKYSDKTIYSFSDMTTNIGKFTNAGVKLEDAVMAIKGISNEAAVSGANANEASRAMYNFAQALSAGYVKLIDWKSIENANMATVEFKNQLLESAVAAGTLEKTSDGMYRVLSKNAQGSTMDDVIDATHNFNDSLSYQWMTTEALVSTLKNYADETTAIGKKAFAAAQDVKTFSMMMDTLKEAAQSGWAQTWELIVGDFEEGKTLWTDLATVFGALIDRSATARNELLKGWKDLGGRDDLMQSFKNLFNAVANFITPIKDAFREFFPPATAKQLKDITQGIENFTRGLIPSVETSDKLRQTFRGLFAVLDIGKKTFSSALTIFGELLKPIFGLSGGILDATSSFGKWMVVLHDSMEQSKVFETTTQNLISIIDNVKESVKRFFSLLASNIKLPTLDSLVSFFEKIHDSISAFFQSENSQSGKASNSPIIGFFSSLLDVTKKISGKTIDTLSTAIQKLISVLGNADFSGIMSVLNSGILASIGIGIPKFINSLTGKGSLANSLSQIKELFLDTFGAIQSQIKSKTLLNIASAIAILAGSLLVLSSIDSEALGGSLSAITVLFVDLSGALAALDKLLGNNGMKSGTSAVTSLIAMSVSILLLSTALKKVASIDPESLNTGLLGILGLSATLVAAMSALKVVSASFKGGNMKGLISFSIAIGMMTASLKSIADLDAGKLEIGLLGILGLSATLVAAETALKAVSSSFKGGNMSGLISFSAAIGVLTVSLKSIAELDTNQLIIGLTGIAGLAAIIGITISALQAVSSKCEGASISSLISFSIALGILTISLKSIAELPVNDLISGMAGIAGLAAVMSIALGALAVVAESIGGVNFLLVSTSLIAMASAILILTPALTMLGNMDLLSIAKALGTIAAAFTVLGVAGLVLSPIIPAILALSASLALIGVGVLSVGTGLLAAGAGLSAISVGLLALATSGAAGATEIVAALSVIITGVASLIPSVATMIAQGIITFALTISNGAGQIATSIATVITQILSTIAMYMPSVVQSGMLIILSILQGIGNNTKSLVESAILVITEFINGIANSLPRIIDAGANLVISFVNGIADAIRKHSDAMADAGLNLASAMIEGMVNGLLKGVKWVVEEAKKVGSSVVSTIKDVFDINSPSRLMEKFGLYVDEGLANGIDKGGKEPENSAKKVSNGVVDALSSGLDKFAQKSDSFISDEKGTYRNFWDELTATTEEGVTENTEIEKQGLADSKETAAEAKKTRTESLMTEKDYWSQLLETYKQGIDAKKYQSMSLADFEKSILEQTTDIWGAYIDEFKNKRESLMNDSGIFAEVQQKEAVSAEQLTKNLQDQINQMAQYEAVMASLNSRISSQGLKDAINKMGVDSLAELQALNSMTDAQLTNYVALYDQKYAMCGQAAMTQLSGLQTETEQKLSALYGGVNVNLQTFAQAFDGSFASIKSYVATAIDTGTQIATGVGKGIAVGTEDAKLAASQMITDTEQAARDAALISSPSQRFADQVGTYIGQGVAQGIVDNNSKLSISSSVYELVAHAISEFESKFGDFQQAGSYCAEGFAQGLLSQIGSVASAAGQVAAAAYHAATAYLSIMSPSRKFMEIGRYTDEGMAIGLKKYVNVVEGASESVGETALNSMSAAVSRITEAMNSDFDDDLTIRPVLDLSNIQNGLWRLDEMTRNRGFDLSGSLALAQQTASSMSRPKSVSEQSGDDQNQANLEKAVRDLIQKASTPINNTFYINGSNAQEIADEVARIIQRQIERNGAKWA